MTDFLDSRLTPAGLGLVACWIALRLRSGAERGHTESRDPLAAPWRASRMTRALLRAPIILDVDNALEEGKGKGRVEGEAHSDGPLYSRVYCLVFFAVHTLGARSGW